MIIINHVQFIQDDCSQLGNRAVINGSVHKRISLRWSLLVPVTQKDWGKHTFSNVQTPISKSCQVALTFPPPKKPTTRTEPSSARRRHMLLLSSASESSGYRNSFTTFRSHRTFSWTSATYGRTRRALEPFSPSILLSMRTGLSLVDLATTCREYDFTHGQRPETCRPLWEHNIQDSSLRLRDPDP